MENINTAIQGDENRKTIYSILHNQGMEKEKQDFTRIVTDFACLENHIDDLSHEIKAMQSELEHLKGLGVKAKAQKAVQTVKVKLNDIKSQFIFIKRTFINNVKSVIHNIKEAGIHVLQKLSKILHIRPALMHLKKSVLQANKEVISSFIQIRDTRIELSAARTHFKNAFARIRNKYIPTHTQQKENKGILANLESRFELMDKKLKSIARHIDKAIDKIEAFENRKINYQKPLLAELREIRRQQEKKSKTIPQKQNSQPKHFR